jgi:hypothetical protein
MPDGLGRYTASGRKINNSGVEKQKIVFEVFPLVRLLPWLPTDGYIQPNQLVVWEFVYVLLFVCVSGMCVCVQPK